MFLWSLSPAKRSVEAKRPNEKNDILGPVRESDGERESEGEEYVELPANKKQCPAGYKAALVEGRKKCRKTQKVKQHAVKKQAKTRTKKSVEPDDYIDIPEGKKQCPKGYKAALVEGQKRCKKNVTKKVLEIVDDGE